MTQDRADEIFSTELGQQLGVIYVTSDDKPFIRYEEAVKHRNDLMFENLDNIVDSKIVEWYPENRNKMMGWISVEDKLPENGEMVFVYLGNYRQSQKYDVVKFEKGISQEERQQMKDGLLADEGVNVYSNGHQVVAKRSSMFTASDEEGNNTKPYSWSNLPMRYFGQDVTHWMPLPSPPKQ
jgi:hypothetical protein